MRSFIRFRVGLAWVAAVVVLACVGCSAPPPGISDLRAALRLRAIDEALQADGDRRISSVQDVRISDVSIERAQALPSGSFDVWTDYTVVFKGRASRQSNIVTLEPTGIHRWRVLSIRAVRAASRSRDASVRPLG